MLKASHIHIGSVIYACLKDRFGITLDKGSFLSGCVLPDINQFYSLGHPHFPRLSMSFVQREIAYLSETYPEDENGKISPEYSVLFGIICHYYADFFCHAHNSGFRQLIFNHVKYEYRLQKYLKANIGRIYKSLDLFSDIGGSTDEINNNFLRLHSEYSNMKHSFETDIAFTLFISIRSALSIINCSYSNAAAEAEALPVMI
jgi:hypothetical protein